jgi:hypothetical protein
MAIFHLNAKVISRGKGQSAVAAAAYRSGDRLRDEQTGEQKFYKQGADRIAFTDIMAPKDAPEWAHDRNRLWNEAERAEKRKDAQLAREIEVSLPHELTAQQREWLVKDFAREAFVRQGYAVDIAIHAPYKDSDDRNHHAHLMVTMRTLGPDGFAAKKDRALNGKAQLADWRRQWANLANRHLERHGHKERIDHRSLKEQGAEREPTTHLGYAANEMAQRGAQSDRMDALQDVLKRNEIRVDMKTLDTALAALERQERRDATHEAQSPSGVRAWRDDIAEHGPKPGKGRAPDNGGIKVVSGATGLVFGLGDFITNLLAGPSPTKKPLVTRLDKERAEKALGRMGDDMQAGRNLRAEDVQNLTHEQKLQILSRGDDAVRQMVEDERRRTEQRARDDDRGRGMER